MRLDFYHGKLSTIVGFLFLAIQKFKDGKKGNRKAKKVDIEHSKHTDASASKALTEGEGKSSLLFVWSVNLTHRSHRPCSFRTFIGAKFAELSILYCSASQAGLQRL